MQNNAAKLLEMAEANPGMLPEEWLNRWKNCLAGNHSNAKVQVFDGHGLMRIECASCGEGETDWIPASPSGQSN